MYFSTVPPSFSMSRRSWLKAAPSAALRRSGGVDDGEVVDVPERCRRFPDDRRDERQGLKKDRCFVELAVRLGEELLRSRLGLAACQDGRTLCRAADLGDLRRGTASRDVR